MRAVRPSVADRLARAGDDGSSWLWIPDSTTRDTVGRTTPGGRRAITKRRGAAGRSQLAPQDVPGPDTGYFFFFAAFFFVPFFFAAFFLAAM